jgi:glycosyltransferase involved in cell wall biosynthesis
MKKRFEGKIALDVDVLFVFPGTLEALTKRGGGREEVLLRVATELSSSFNVSIVAPFFRSYKKVIMRSSSLMIENVYFPALKNYPPKNRFSSVIHTFSIILFYQLLLVMKIIQLKKNKLKIIILSDAFSGIIPAVVAKLLNIKIVYYEGNIIPWADPYIFPRNIDAIITLWRSFNLIVRCTLCKLANAIIVNDGLIMEGMVKHDIRKSKIFIVRGGVDTSTFSPIEVAMHLKAEFHVGFIGRLTEEKGAPILLKLCKTAINMLPQVKFMIFGDGPYKKYFETLPNVKHIGWVDHNTLPKWLSLVDVILSFQKTFGKAEKEALSCGKPIIAFKIGEMSMLIKDKETGLLCSPCIDSLIEAISKLVNDESLLKRLSENARREAITRYDWNIIGRLWKNIVEYVLKNEVGIA